MRLLLLPLLIVFAVVAIGCSRESAPEPADAAAMAAFATAEHAWRAQRRERLVAPDGWTSLVGLHWIERGDHFVGSAPTNGVRIAMGSDLYFPYPPGRGAGSRATMDGYVEAGLTPVEALRTATWEAGRLLGDDGLGVLKERSWADLVAVQGDARAGGCDLRGASRRSQGCVLPACGLPRARIGPDERDGPQYRSESPLRRAGSGQRQ